MLNISWLQNRSRQTVQTQIRLLLKKQSDQCLPYFDIHFVNSRYDCTNILFTWQPEFCMELKSVNTFDRGQSKYHSVPKLVSVFTQVNYPK